MAITKEAIQTRLKELKATREKLQADINAYDGAIQDCKYWLAEAKEKEKNEEEEKEEQLKNMWTEP